MLQDFTEAVALYDYSLPPDRIAQVPADPRDSAKLLVYKRSTNKIEHRIVRDLPRLLPPNAVLVLNETKVIPARLPLMRVTGGKVDVLFLKNHRGRMHALSNKRLRVGEVLHMRSDAGTSAATKMFFTVTGSVGKEWILKPSFPLKSLPTILRRHGVMPLPPYIKHSPLTQAEIRDRYQTVFAKNAGSIAAPTASLHFTKKLLAQIKKSGVTIARVTLHVHLGTFSPLTEEQWKTGKLHPEFYSIDAATARLLTRAKKEGRPIIAAGTTVARTLESASSARGVIIKPSGTTRLFIRPPYDFKMVDAMLTNFHVPRSSLLMLVSSLTGREQLLDLYKDAMRHDFRFFSFGDAMLIL